jgi:UDP-N-acetylmuramoyl-tripeptide--D-alanyl-D-alanine ligase
MKDSLRTFAKAYPHEKKLLVLGDMLELGSDEIQFHRALLSSVLDTKPDGVLLFGKRMSALHEELRGLATFWTDDYSELQKVFSEWLPNHSAIFLKGSRSMKLERLMNWVESEMGSKGEP